MKEIRTEHQHVDGSCPRVVYIYWEKGELRTLPTVVHLHLGEGLRWVPLGDAETFKAEFQERESPFATHQFDEKLTRSGPTTVQLEKRSSFPCTVTYEKGTTVLEVFVEPVAEARIQTKTIKIKLVNGKISVVPSSAFLWKNIDEVVWSTIPEKQEFEVIFDENSPFVRSTFDEAHPRSGPGVRVGTYKYTVRFMGAPPLDPDVEVEDPNGGP